MNFGSLFDIFSLTFKGTMIRAPEVKPATTIITSTAFTGAVNPQQR